MTTPKTIEIKKDKEGNTALHLLLHPIDHVERTKIADLLKASRFEKNNKG